MKISHTTINNEIFTRMCVQKKWKPKSIYSQKSESDELDPTKINAEYIELNKYDVQYLDLKIKMSQIKAVNIYNPRIIRYKVGGFMKEHIDLKQNDKYHARIILLPPSNHRGGILKVSELEFKNPSLDSEYWDVIYVPYGIKHEVTSVLWGIRYCIVMDVEFSDPTVIDDFRPWESESEHDSEEIECDVGPHNDDRGLFSDSDDDW